MYSRERKGYNENSTKVQECKAVKVKVVRMNKMSERNRETDSKIESEIQHPNIMCMCVRACMTCLLVVCVPNLVI